jgi:bifunctional ADP-heptose synthase (sugar kinase/adenylyltransferase)
MRQEADRVVVVLHDDKSTFENKGRFPVQDYQHRKANLIASGFVDEIFEARKADPSGAFSLAITLYRPVVYMRGDDWPDFPGKGVLEISGIPIKLVAYTEGVSSTEIRERLKK